MGMNEPPNKCHLTDLTTTDIPSSNDLAEYSVDFNNNKIIFRFPSDHKNSEFVKANKHIIQGLILNNKFPKEYFGIKGNILDHETLESIINESVTPKLPEEKINNLLNYLHSLQKFEGAEIELPKLYSNFLAQKLYFKNIREFHFYLSTLATQKLIKYKMVTSSSETNLRDIKLTYKGLSKVIEINESGNQSNRCFVAMSFSKDLKDVRDTLKTAINNSGFKPILIDEIHYEADITINDALIAQIKKCKFLVADFTEHKHGVYFEAGFALGLKRPVIYVCNKKDFENTHFDTKHYPHIIYSNLDELIEKLENKINAWIN